MHSLYLYSESSIHSTHHSNLFVDCTCGDGDDDDGDDDDDDDDDDSIDYPWNPIHLLVDQLHLLPGNHQGNIQGNIQRNHHENHNGNHHENQHNNPHIIS